MPKFDPKAKQWTVDNRKKPSTQRQYKDVTWLMPHIDVKDVLDRLGVLVVEMQGDEIIAWCPDHEMHVHRRPSHPKWSLNVKTGKTICSTEGRGSNLVFTAARLLGCTSNEAVEWMTGESGDAAIASLRNLSATFQTIASPESEPKRTVRGMNDMRNMLATGCMYKDGYRFFIQPPDKKRTDIQAKTVDHFGCIQVRSGWYANRVIIPFYLHDELMGWCATDILGKKEWIRRHPTLSGDEYKKVLYPKGFKRGQYLFGVDNIQVGAEYVVIAEGAREVMKLWQHGHDAVAVLGSAISDGQVELLASLGPKKVVIMMDGDDAGYEAQRRIAKKLGEFLDARKCIVPHGFDPKALSPKKIGGIIGKALT